MFSRRHGHRHGHGHGYRLHRHGGRHEKFGHSFRYPESHMEHDSYRRRHHRGPRGFDFGECCFSENDTVNETTQNKPGEKIVCERRHHWRHGRCCGDKVVPENSGNTSDSAMDEGNVEPKKNNEATASPNREAPTVEKMRRCYCMHRRYLSCHLKDVLDKEKEASAVEGERQVVEPEKHRTGKGPHRHERQCRSEESSSENEVRKDRRIRHGPIRRHHHYHHGGKRGHNDYWEILYGAHSDGEKTCHENTAETQDERRMFRGRHGGKFHGHHHRGWKGSRCCIIMVDSATNTEDLDISASNQDEPNQPTNQPLPSLVELIELDGDQDANQEEGASTSADQVSEVADDLKKSSLE